MKFKSNRTNRGQFIAETPATLWFLFFLVAFPMIVIATYGMNALFLYYACRDAAYQCAKSSKFSSGSVLAAATVGTDTANNPGVQIVSTQTLVIQKEINASGNGVESIWNVGDPIQSGYLYFIQEKVRGRLSCIISMLPPYEVETHFECYVENPQGLND